MAKVIRFAVKGKNDSYICLAEDKTDDAKKITYVLGGWGNNVSTVKWMPKGQPGNHGWHGGPNDEFSFRGKVHEGPMVDAWIEVEWDIPDAKGPCMQISKILDQSGAGKHVMSKFPMKDVKPNWMMMASGCGSAAVWKVIVYSGVNPPAPPVENLQTLDLKDGVLEAATKKVAGHGFKWPDCVGGDISQVKVFRFAVKGTNDSYICFAEENLDDSKKITYILGGWGNTTSVV
jgi:hypothetical protein